MKKEGTKLLSQAYALPAQSLQEGKKLIQQGLSSIPTAIRLGKNLQYNVEMTKDTSVDTTELIQDIQSTMTVFQDVFLNNDKDT